ncbi:hypothetical protein PR202_ga23561 [Eleusine coracana subsp. coracana]|uniref:Secreted protein n=1 Tax=Eleusine coracana subsp. coracana TaxID=191504 RepID=A0AAV5D5H2_ELECO|nr:hypothetical protein PR202_ga23561 [Eleusine coracana subsp. coracana]
MALTCGFLISSLGTVTVSTPFSMAACTWSVLAPRGSRNRLWNLPLLRSTWRHASSLPASSRAGRSPEMTSTSPSSTSTLASSFFTPGRSTLNTCAAGVSFQSMRTLVRTGHRSASGRTTPNGSASAQKSSDIGSNTLAPLRTNDIIN